MILNRIFSSFFPKEKNLLKEIDNPNAVDGNSALISKHMEKNNTFTYKRNRVNI